MPSSKGNRRWSGPRQILSVPPGIVARGVLNVVQSSVGGLEDGGQVDAERGERCDLRRGVTAAFAQPLTEADLVAVDVFPVAIRDVQMAVALLVLASRCQAATEGAGARCRIGQQQHGVRVHVRLLSDELGKQPPLLEMQGAQLGQSVVQPSAGLMPGDWCAVGVSLCGVRVSVVVLPCHTQGGFHQRSTALSASRRSLCKLLSAANSRCRASHHRWLDNLREDGTTWLSLQDVPEVVWAHRNRMRLERRLGPGGVPWSARG